jgi:cellulose synthase/poly-beta-1,6-N-acetylglucosamine synthase-like glycosyltransferase
MHGFGIFGGSNGYWRTDLLHQTRMRGSMLTEDIDASLRTVIAGGRIVSDPGLVSYELAPTTLPALWRQRMRWAQGWSQVSRRHLWKAVGSPALTIRQKLGLAWLLGWREVYPWLSPQIYPLILFGLLHPVPGDGFRLNVSLYLLAALFSTMVSPTQALFAYALADPTIRRRRRWFGEFCLVNIVYSEFKNVIARLAPVKELLREHDWHVTPRQAPSAGPDAPSSHPPKRVKTPGSARGRGSPPAIPRVRRPSP